MSRPSQSRVAQTPQRTTAQNVCAERSRGSSRTAKRTAHSNQALQRKLIQAKLAVNQPGDAFEREADQAADAVMRMDTARDRARLHPAWSRLSSAPVFPDHKPRQGSNFRRNESSINDSPLVLRRQPSATSSEKAEKTGQIENLIRKNWKKYIDHAKFKSPLKDRITWYASNQELIVAKWNVCRNLAEEHLRKAPARERKELFDRHKALASSDQPTFEQVQPYIIGTLQTEFFEDIGSENIPGFYDPTTGKIHITGDKVGLIAHEALHSYSSPEFKQVLGRDLDEGMSQYLAEEVEHDYMAEYAKDRGIMLVISAYGEQVKTIRELVDSGAIKKDDLLKAYFQGGKQLLQRIQKAREKALKAVGKKEDNSPEQVPKAPPSPASPQAQPPDEQQPLQRTVVDSRGPSETAPGIVEEVLSSPGQALDEATRDFMEPRFGADFSGVRVHTGAEAAESARAVNALAYTVGNNIVFGAGQFAASEAGRRVLSHELAHVVQQGAARKNAETFDHRDVQSPRPPVQRITPLPGSVSLQRAFSCDTFAYRGRATGVSKAPGRSCVDDQGDTGITTTSPNSFERFGESASTLSAAHRGQIATLQSSLTSSGVVEIHGYASCDGAPDFNLNLSCDRAEAVRAGLTSGAKPFTGSVRTFAHGETDEFGPSLVSNRRVMVLITHAAPPPTPVVLPKCGPDVTDWFVDEINKGSTEAAVLDVQRVNRIAGVLGAKRGTRAELFAESGATGTVEAQEAKLKALGPAPPPRAGAIVSQLAAGHASESAAAKAVASALATDPLHPGEVAADFTLMTAAIGAAALKWRALVNHKARFDFKNHILDKPAGAHCPDLNCNPGEHGTITLCPGAGSPQNCYESDLPGNVFYALIGRLAGFSELTLQLGSQLAELTDLPRPPVRPAITWDSPEDTAAIHLGFSLGAALPISRSSLCSAIVGARSVLDSRTDCSDCSDVFPLHFV